MKHRKRGRQLGRNPAHRAALRRNLLRNFLQHQSLVTTQAKAKEIQPHLEKLISLARTRSLANVRRALRLLGHDRELVAKLFDEIAPQFADRPGGYTRVLKLAKPRLGDAAPRARLELVTGELAERPAPKPAVADEGPEEEAPGAEAETSSEEAEQAAAAGDEAPREEAGQPAGPADNE